MYTKHFPYPHSTPAQHSVTLRSHSFLNNHHVFNGRNPKQKDHQTFTQNKYVRASYSTNITAPEISVQALKYTKLGQPRKCNSVTYMIQYMALQPTDNVSKVTLPVFALCHSAVILFTLSSCVMLYYLK
jgi:hypothetical protein